MLTSSGFTVKNHHLNKKEIPTKHLKGVYLKSSLYLIVSYFSFFLLFLFFRFVVRRVGNPEKVNVHCLWIVFDQILFSFKQQ